MQFKDYNQHRNKRHYEKMYAEYSNWKNGLKL